MKTNTEKTDLVHIYHNKPFTDSLIISIGINDGIYDNKKHKTTIALIRKHKIRLEKFGRVAFQKRPFRSGLVG